MSRKKTFRLLVFSLILLGLLYLDFSQAEKGGLSPFRSYKYLSEFDAVTSATSTVAIVRSDDEALPHPIPVDDESISYTEIEAMVRRAIELAGGLNWIIQPGHMVLLKPNIVDPEPPGSGEVTDVRVIKALIKIIDELAPGQIEIVVGEGSPRPMDYEMKYQSKFSTPCWEKLWDKAGYQDLLTDTCLSGINFRLSNLNGSPPENPWEDLVEVEIPGGGEADPQGGKYFIHKDVINADVFITVPVMKIHDPGMTVALKNQIGLAPSTMYGFSKTAGVSQDNYKHKLIHTSQMPKYWTHKEIVDLSRLANIRFAVVDAIACLELNKEAMYSGNVITNLVRMNTIIASPDPVATDHVCARLMGLNPDDIEHITLAERIGLGINNPDNIHIEGADLDQTKRRFKKNQSATADFGQSNRIWLLKGPYSIDGISDPINYDFISDEATIKPSAGANEWSEAIYFRDDHIDLENYFNIGSSDKVVGYAFAYFGAPQNQEAELWIGSDEALKIYINSNEVYNYNGTRSFPVYDFVSTKVKVNIKAGENTLLVKSLQKYGRYDFCLNICEPESDSYYDGNRIWGLKFKTISNSTAIEQRELKTTLSYELHDAYPNPFNPMTVIEFKLHEPAFVTLKIYNLIGQEIAILVNGFQTAGEYKVTWQPRNLPSGLYFYRLLAGDFSITKKLLLQK